jgi:hypothetical protein
MRWDRKVGKILLVLVGGVAIGALVIGLFAFLVAGKDGLVNGLIWGAAFGLIGGLFAAGNLIFTLFWSDVAGEAGDAINDPNRDPDFKFGEPK